MFPRWQFIVFWIPLLFNSVAAGQAKFEHFTTDNGLSQNTILSIIQDRTGYLWIGTEDGLNRYDGYEFKKYHDAAPHDSLGLPDDQIWSLLEDDFGRIWIGHGKGISLLNPDTQKFETVLLEKNLLVCSSFQDSSGNIWFGTAGAGLVKIDRRDFAISRYTNSAEPLPPYDLPTWSLVSNYILSVIDYRDGLLVGTRGAGVFFFKDGVFSRPPLEKEFEDQLLVNDVWSMIKNRQGEYFLGTVKGLGKFSKNLDKGKWYRHITGKNSLSSDRIARLCLNGNEGMWIATYGGGLNYLDFDSEVFTSYSKSVEAGSLTSDLTFTILVDGRKNIWIGTWAGGLNKLNSHARLFSGYSEASGLKDSYITSLSAKGDTVIVASYSSGLYLLIDGKERQSTLMPIKPHDLLQPNYIRSVHIGSKIWVGLNGGGVAVTDRYFKNRWKYFKKIPGNDHSLNNHLVEVVLEDSFGTIWVGTQKSGLKRIFADVEYGKPGSIQHFTPIVEDTLTLPNDDVRTLFFDSANYLWVGTQLGLCRSVVPVTRDLMPNEFIRYGSHVITAIQYGFGSLWVGTDEGLYRLHQQKLERIESLSGEFINSIVPDSGKMWITTNTGLLCYYPTGNFKRYTVSDGLLSNEFNLGAACVTKSGRYFFGGVNGFISFFSDRFEDKNISAGTVINKITLNNDQELHGYETLELANTDKIIEFEFSLLDFTNPSLNTYQYQMVGFEDSWTSPSLKRRATYTNLSPGNYVFKVRGINAQGVASQEKQVAFVVLPPLWKTWWAYVLYGVTFIAAGLGARMNIVNRERLRAKLKLEHLELEKLKELDEFKSKFFANISHEFRTPLTLILGNVELLKINGHEPDALSSIQRNGKEVLDLVNQLLDLSRIDAGKLELQLSGINLNEFLKAHVSVFQSLAQQKRIQLSDRYADKNAFVTLDSSILEKVINNLISNAIKYTPPNGKVLFSAMLRERVLEISVEDTGIGMEQKEIEKIFDRFYRVDESTSGTGIGLALTFELIKLHKGTIKVTSIKGKGSCFMVCIPVSIGGTIKDVEKAPLITAKSITEIAWPANPQAHPGSHQVLVVEDNEELRYFLKHNLHGFEVSVASNADEGLKMAIQFVPDVIVTDWMMPGKTGIELCRDVKSSEITSHIPVIILTAKAGLEPKLEGLETGADDYLTKPFEMQELTARIRNLIAQRTLLREKFSKAGNTTSTKKILSADERFIKRFYQELEKSISDSSLTVESLSREMGISRVQLHRKLSALFGHAASDLIRDYRLQRAADMLRQKAGNVSEIAFQVGFENLSYFSKAFREKFHKTPSEY